LKKVDGVDYLHDVLVIAVSISEKKSRGSQGRGIIFQGDADADRDPLAPRRQWVTGLVLSASGDFEAGTSTFSASTLSASISSFAVSISASPVPAGAPGACTRAASAAAESAVATQPTTDRLFALLQQIPYFGVHSKTSVFASNGLV